MTENETTVRSVIAVFEEWLRRYQADPSVFEGGDLLDEIPEPYGERMAAYFFRLLGELPA